jgi:hypothetical protein
MCIGPTGPPEYTGKPWHRWQHLWYKYLRPYALRSRFTDGMLFRYWLADKIFPY